jgi:hypothetical protein
MIDRWGDALPVDSVIKVLKKCKSGTILSVKTEI